MSKAQRSNPSSRNASFIVKTGVGLVAAYALMASTLAFAQIRTVYIIPASHFDRGFVTNPEQLLPRLKPHIDEVLDDAAADPEFRWIIESIWQLNEWLKRTDDPQRIALLRDLVKKGQIEISASYGSMHAEFMGAEELNLLTQDSFRMARALGIDPPDFAMMDDVPGSVRWLPQVFAGSRVRYFLNGASVVIGGGTSLFPRHVPFYWQAPDGSRVLTWVSQGKNGGYTEGMADYYVAPTTPDPYPPHESMLPKDLQGKPPLEVMDLGMKKLRETYEKAGYKYDAVLVMYVHDFIAPSAEKDHLLPLVRQWNASGREPHLRVATPKEFFTYILSKYGSEIPTYGGEWNGLWSQVKTNSPEISSLAREVQTQLTASSLLWGALQLRSGLGLPTGNFLDDYRRLWNYDEHAGAGQLGWPGVMTVQEVNDQNRDYVGYIRKAWADENFLLASVLRRAVENPLSEKAAESKPRTGPLLAVFQPLSWQATSVIEVPKIAEFQNARALKDAASGTIYPVQWTDSGGKMLAPLPASGVSLFEVAEVAANEASVSEVADTPVLENRFYRLELRLADGAIVHLVDRESGRDLVNTAARDGFNELLRSAGFTRAPGAGGKARFQMGRGQVFDFLRVLHPGTYAPMTEYRLYHAAKRLEIRDLLDRSLMPLVSSGDRSNGYQFTFPFFAGATIDSLHYESGYGMTTFPGDYLPGARMDAVVTHGLVLSAGDVQVALSSDQAFYWDLPGFAAGSGKLRDNEVVSTALLKNDADSTRDLGTYLFPTVEPGLSDRLCFVYTLTSWKGVWNDGEAYRKIWESAAPAVVTLAPGMSTSAAQNAAGSLFATDQPDVVLLAAEPSLTQANAVVLRLQEIAGATHEVRIKLPAERLEATQVDLTEAVVGAGRLPVKSGFLEVEVAPHATVSILVSRPSK